MLMFALVVVFSLVFYGVGYSDGWDMRDRRDR